jgi:uncharacterized protein involved in exopolysaccharide biosynthesis
MADSEFTPFETLASVFSRWWITVIMAVLGGVVGLAFHLFQPPVYQATAIITVTMDFSQRELTQYEQDYAFNAAGGMVNSTAVVDQIILKAKLNGITLSQRGLKTKMALEAMQSVWEMHIRDQDPQVAAELANIWAGVALDGLNTALDHAMQAEQYQHEITILETCLPSQPDANQPGAIPPPTPKDCERYSLQEIQAALRDSTDALVQEKQLTFGILPTMEFAMTSLASIPENPVIFNQAGLVLAGAVIGFVISLWGTSIRRVKRRG